MRTMKYGHQAGFLQSLLQKAVGPEGGCTFDCNVGVKQIKGENKCVFTLRGSLKRNRLTGASSVVESAPKNWPTWKGEIHTLIKI